MKKELDIKQVVREHYAAQVKGIGCCCGSGCCNTSSPTVKGFGRSNYDDRELAGIPEEAVLNSLGCGNPLVFAGITAGQTVVDIGSGAGLDAIMAARKVGPDGKVIGLDMTPEMIKKAEENVRKAGLGNVEFVLGDAENIPLPAETADWVISNCVINLSPDKERVFEEIYRILKPRGRILISDIVTENVPQEVLGSLNAWAGCVAGAISEQEYLAAATKAGLRDVQVVDRVDYDLSIIKPYLEEFPGRWESMRDALVNNGTRVSSIRLIATKPAAI